PCCSTLPPPPLSPTRRSSDLDVAGDDGAEVAVDADAAALADLALGDVVSDGVGLDAGVGDDQADAAALDVDAATDAQGVGGAIDGGQGTRLNAGHGSDEDRVS